MTSIIEPVSAVGPTQRAGTVEVDQVRLLAGAAAGPLFVTVAAVQMVVRDGFDLSRHAISMLSLGEHGWIQIINFILSGALVLVACPVTRARLGGRSGAVAAVGLGLYGVGLLIAGVFTPDPAFGFPAGAPAGAADPISWHGWLHAAGFGIAQLGVVIAGVATATALRRSRGWVAYLLLSVSAIPVAMAVPAPIGFGIRAAIVTAVTWTWLTLVLLRLRRTSA